MNVLAEVDEEARTTKGTWYDERYDTWSPHGNVMEAYPNGQVTFARQRWAFTYKEEDIT